MSIEMRKILHDALAIEMGKNKKIVIINADLGKANGLLSLRDQFGARVFNAGIAEQNMVCMAAGMASYGMIPIVNSFATFASRRACDQISISVAYAHQNVKIIGTDPGVCAEANGGTHMAMDDIGALRSIPGLMIVEPCDGEELRQMIPAILDHDGPVYFRCGRKILPDVYDSTYQFSLEHADIVRKGKDISIFASGVTVADALEAASRLALADIEAEVINIHTIKPIDANMVINSVQKTGAAIVVENHNVLGGVGSAVSEIVTQYAPVLIERLGYQDVKGEVGTIQSLKVRFGIDIDSIVTSARRVFTKARGMRRCM